jgi:uncharacterized membrane protein required for colicin V production
MSDHLLLDILLGLIVALFAAIGFWRGVVKEAIATAAILGGAAIAASWANPWGGDLADLANVRVDVARAIVAGLALLVPALFLGYGGGSLVADRPRGLGARLGGATVAAINGCLLLHFGLYYVDLFLADDEAKQVLVEGHASRLLLHQFGWFLVGSASLLAVMLAAGWQARRRARLLPRSAAYDAWTDERWRPDAAPRQRGLRLPRRADDGKYEPLARGFDATSERYAADAPRASQTMPLAAVDPSRLLRDGGAGGPVNGSPAGDRFGGDEWLRQARTPAGGADRTVAADLNGTGGPERRREATSVADQWFRSTPAGPTGGESDVDRSATSSRPEPAAGALASEALPNHQPGSNTRTESAVGRVERCRRCTAALGPGDSFCPRCGAAVD